MINYFIKSSNHIAQVSNGDLSEENIIWVDLVNASIPEIDAVEKRFETELFTDQESQEIESSSKFVESDDEIGINMNFLNREAVENTYEPVSFIIKNKILITEREHENYSFKETYKKLNIAKPEDGDDVFLIILDVRIDYLADIIEEITDKIAQLSKDLVQDEKYGSDTLLEVTSMQIKLLGIRESIVEIQRLLSSFTKSKLFPVEDKEAVYIMQQDLSSIMEYTNFCFDRLEFLQQTFRGLASVEQNKIMKFFTVMTVIFAPATLIAGIYGMNFKNMPELEWYLGYPMALLLMIFIMGITILYFKYKKWL